MTLKETYSTLSSSLYESENVIGKITDKIGLKYEKQIKPDKDENIFKLFKNEILGRKRISNKLQELGKYFEGIFDKANDGFLLAREDGRFIIANKKICEMLGYDLEEITKLSVQDIHPKDSSGIVGFPKTITGEIPLVKDVSVLRKDKTIFYVDINTSIINVEGKKYILGIFRDITERKLLQEEIIKSERLESMTKLSAGVVHEINNPLYGISNYLELLNEEKDENKRKNYIEMISQGVKILKTVTNNLLDLSKLDLLKPEKININKLLEESVSFLMPEMLKTKIKLSMKIQTNIPDLNIDRTKIKQVFINIITNAIESMPGGGNLEIITKHVNMKISILFIDSGIGIAEENIGRIFEPFFSDKKKFDRQSIGLGLFISMNIINLHKGEIKVKSKKGQGTTFEIILPE